MLSHGQTITEFMLECLAFRRRTLVIEKMGRWTAPSSWRWNREYDRGERILDAGPLHLIIAPKS